MSKKQKRIFWPVAFIIALALSALAFAGTRKALGSKALPPASASVAASTVATAVATPSPQLQVPLEVEVVTVSPHGFEPKQIRRPAGPFILLIENRSGLNSIALHLDFTSAVTNVLTVGVLQMQLSRGQLDWMGTVPGL